MIVSKMTDSSSSSDIESVDTVSEIGIIFDSVFGTVLDIQYYMSSDSERYAVVIEEGGTCEMMLVYGIDPVVHLLWVFRSIESAVWGDVMWADNENVIDVAEAIGEDTEIVLVTENVNGMYVLKFLTHDVDVEEWRVYLLLHEEGRESDQSVLDESSYHTGSSDEPPLEEESSLGP